MYFDAFWWQFSDIFSYFDAFWWKFSEIFTDFDAFWCILMHFDCSLATISLILMHFDAFVWAFSDIFCDFDGFGMILMDRVIGCVIFWWIDVLFAVNRCDLHSISLLMSYRAILGDFSFSFGCFRSVSLGKQNAAGCVSTEIRFFGNAVGGNTSQSAMFRSGWTVWQRCHDALPQSPDSLHSEKFWNLTTPHCCVDSTDSIFGWISATWQRCTPPAFIDLIACLIGMNWIEKTWQRCIARCVTSRRCLIELIHPDSGGEW